MRKVRYDYKLDAPERPQNDGEGDPECEECWGAGYTLEQDEDSRLSYRAECDCVKRRREAAEDAGEAALEGVNRLQMLRYNLEMIRDKHERTGGPDEQQLADWGRSS